jgi:glyoxylase-like metal-dependent hydrolase (beta-lactamase superfamily II)
MRTGLLVILLAVTGAAAPPPETVIETVKVSDRVYAFVGPDPTREIVVGNAVAVIGDDAVLLVDTTNAPSNARVMLAELRKVTDKPVRYIVHTHWHYDHIMGDTVFAKEFAPLDVIAHAKTLPVLDEKIPAWPKRATEVYTRILGQYGKELADGKDAAGNALSAQDRKRYRQTMSDAERYMPELSEMSYVRPTIVVDSSTAIYLGSLEVRVLYFGRGNTDGDLAVYVPQERVLATGDLLVHPVPYSFNSHLEEWARGLGRMAELDVATIVPGHGPVFADKEYLLSVKQLLESTLAQTREAKRKGLSLEEAQRTIELEPFRKRFAGDDPARNEAWTDYFRNPAVASVYGE